MRVSTGWMHAAMATNWAVGGGVCFARKTKGRVQFDLVASFSIYLVFVSFVCRHEIDRYLISLTSIYTN